MLALPNPQEAIDALYNTGGMPRRIAEVAYEKWTRGIPAEPVRHGPLEVDCNCRGCLERLCFIFYDAARQTIYS